MPKKTSKRKFDLIKLVTSILICEGAGVLGSIATYPNISSWYKFLNKPIISPPNWVFGPVWTTLYLLMGISLYIVWQKKGDWNLKWFWIQLILNSLWSFVFFGFRSPLYAFIVILALWFSIYKTIHDFWKIDKKAAVLLLPYFAWVSFASILNLYIAKLNP